VRLLGSDAEVCADGGDAVGVVQAGARGPAVAERFLLVGEREVLAQRTTPIGSNSAACAAPALALA
jgi:hypothetical protein